MKPLGLQFRLDDLTQEGRALAGELSAEVVAKAVGGLVGENGYRAETPARIEGTGWRSAKHEVVLHARIGAQLGFDCVRCLEARSLEVDFAVDHTLVKVDKHDESAEVDLVVEEDEEDQDVDGFVGDRIELQDLLRQDLVLELPMNPTCADAGLEECAAPATQTPEDGVDPRWAPLLELKKNLK